ncbi:basic leucine zipper 19-like [Ananas comosus]|uniref:Basic leucine zipper 19-like n=1 Tax=Ananas comosus TaxID=4615 RepID=A0A6P5FU60_ANACO|nr:basic leucine zipper 19-like [Ananas comosus]
MAQLPPRIPSIAGNWAVNFERSPTMSAPQQPSWVDEFLCFSAARRGAHRRSVSDSVAFLEAPLADCSAVVGGGGGEFDRLDDDQLMSMFSDDVPPPAPVVSSSNPSTPSDHNSINEDQKTAAEQQAEEAQSEEEQPAPGPEPTTFVDPKRVKRILANRQSAQRSRVRKLQYISELERSVTSLQTEVSALSPRVAFLDHQRSLLTVGNSHLKQRIAALAQDKIFKDAHQEALKKEIERLRRVYEQQQNLKKMASPASDASVRGEKELLGREGAAMLCPPS